MRDFVTKVLKAQSNATGPLCWNEFTGAAYVSGIDPIADQVELALPRVIAKEQFGCTGPGGRGLPLNERERDALMRTGVPDDVLFAFWSGSLEACNFDLGRHPSFERYAAGYLALGSGWLPHLVEMDFNVLSRYPPRKLPGLNKNGHWTNSMALKSQKIL